MQIRCPVCDYSRQVNLAKIPSTAEFATCPKCRHRFRFRAVDLDSVEHAVPPEPKPEHADIWDAVGSLHDRWTDKDQNDTADQQYADDDKETPSYGRRQPDNEGIPWENPLYLGYLQSFQRTTFWILFHPASFFASLSRRPALLPALVYYLILGLTQYLFNVIWTHVLSTMLRDSLVEKMGEELYMQIAGNILENSLFTPAVLSVPFQLAIQLFVTAAVIHLLVRIVNPQAADFNLSFKLVAYASAGFVLALLPVIGTLVGPVIYFMFLLIGCRNAFNMPWSKTLMAMVPLLLLMLFAASAQYSHFIGGA